MTQQEPVLLDTSVWVSYLRPSGREDLKSEVRQGLAQGRVYSCSTVNVELLVGARDDQGFARLSDVLRVLPQAPITDDVWEGAARLGYTLRRQGFLAPLPDLLIAQAAIENDLVVWHLDDHFEQIRRFSSLRTRSFLAENV